MNHRWPDFFIIGAPKAATTSIYGYLKDIPGIFLPLIKEPHFFSSELIPSNSKNPVPIRNEIEYLSLYDLSKSTDLLGDSSTTYANPASGITIVKLMWSPGVDQICALIINFFNDDCKITKRIPGPVPCA